MKNIQASYPKDPQVKASIAKIDEHHAKVVRDCDVVNGECQKPKADTVKISDYCVDIDHELQASQKETDALLKYLKIDKLPAPRRSTAKAAAK